MQLITVAMGRASNFSVSQREMGEGEHLFLELNSNIARGEREASQAHPDQQSAVELSCGWSARSARGDQARI